MTITYEINGRAITSRIVQKVRGIEPCALTAYITEAGHKVRKIDVLIWE